MMISPHAIPNGRGTTAWLPQFVGTRGTQKIAKERKMCVKQTSAKEKSHIKHNNSNSTKRKKKKRDETKKCANE